MNKDDAVSLLAVNFRFSLLLKGQLSITSLSGIAIRGGLIGVLPEIPGGYNDGG
jgi:hypothetical protein